jgi:hypothetical protein
VPPFESVNRATISRRDLLSLLLPTRGDRKERQPVYIQLHQASHTHHIMLT